MLSEEYQLTFGGLVNHLGDVLGLSWRRILEKFFKKNRRNLGLAYSGPYDLSSFVSPMPPIERVLANSLITTLAKGRLHVWDLPYECPEPEEPELEYFI